MRTSESPNSVQERFWRLQNLYLIRDKNRKLRKMRFNPAQVAIADVVRKCLIAGKPIRHMDLKARQMGVSTFWLNYYLDDTIFTPNTVSFIVAQKQETLGLLWDAVRLAYNNLPDSIKPKTREDSARTLTFDGINSTMKVSLSVKSTAVHNLDVSEYALCDPSEIEQTIAACPPDANITFETVAEGKNHAFETWNTEDSSMTKLFHPWYIDPGYRLSIPAPLKKTDEEERFCANAKADRGIQIDDEQIAFRRQKKSQLKQSFAEQFAEDDVSCFLQSGGVFFDLRKMKVLLDEAKKSKPLKTGKDWEAWESPVRGHRYVAGADVAEGDGQDSSVLAIICVTCRRTAFRYRARVGVDAFYRICNEWGRAYNHALLAPEENNHGHAVIMGLQELGYKNLFCRNRNTIARVKTNLKYGWRTDADSRPLMLDHLKVALEGDSDEDEEHFEPDITWLDTEFLNETFNIGEVGGKIQARSGTHDDLTMAWAIAYQLYRLSKPILAGKVLGGIFSGDTLESVRLFGSERPDL